MGIYQRNNGYFYIRVREGNKYKRVSLETKNKHIAQEIYNAFLLDKVKSKIYRSYIPFNERQQTQEPKIEKVKTSIKPLYKEYLETCKLKGLEKATLRYKDALLKNLISFKIIYLEDINQKNISPLITFWQRSSKDCMRKHIANFKAFLNHCIKSQTFDASKYQALCFPTPTVNVRDIVIDEKDYYKLLNHCQDEDFKLYMMSLWETGCRPNEIVKLQKKDIDFNKGTAKIYQSKTKKYKTIYLNDELLVIFNKSQKEYIFIGYNKQKEYYAKKFKDLRDTLNLNKEYCLYAFRHSFGTRILNKTKDIHLVSKLLGHSDISITAKHYINRSDSEIRDRLIRV